MRQTYGLISEFSRWVSVDLYTHAAKALPTDTVGQISGHQESPDGGLVCQRDLDGSEATLLPSGGAEGAGSHWCRLVLLSGSSD